MASTNAFLTLVSTVQTNSIGSTISTGFIPFVSTGGRQTYRNMLSLGLSTNQTYNNLSNGSYSNWINAASSLGLSTIKDVAMSSSGQYQLIVVGSSTTLYLSSNSGVTWSALGSSNGLPATSTAYTYGAISTNGQYIIVVASAGSIYVSSNYGTTFVNVSLPSTGPTNWFAFENNTNDSAGSIIPTVTGTMYYVPGKVGNFALNLVNPHGGTAVNYLRGMWTAPANCSVTGWVCPQLMAGGAQIIFSSNSTGFMFFIETNNLFRALVPTTTGAQALINTTITPTPNTWYHFAFIFQTGGTCSLYINGALQGTVNNTNGFAGWTAGTFCLGTYDNSTTNCYSGYIDDFRLYNYAIVPSGAPPQNFNFAAMSGTGQYMTVSSPGNLAYSTNYGQTWTTPIGLTTSGQMSGLAVSNTGQYMLAENGGSIRPNSSAATAPTWAANGVGWTASASTILSGSYPAYGLFNNAYGSGSTYWASANSTYSASSPFAYIGSVSTVIQGVGTIGGEWAQIQSSVPLVLSSYSFACSYIANYCKNYYIVGSTDGTTWSPIQYGAGGTNPLTSNWTACTGYLNATTTGTQYIYGQAGVFGSWTTTSYATSTNPYTYFRIISTNSFGAAIFEMSEWYINFTGGVTYSTTYGNTWVNTGTLASIQTSPCAVSGNGQYTLTSFGSNGQTALVTAGNVASPYAPGSGCVVYYPLSDVAGTTSIIESIGGYYGSLAGSGTTFGNAGKVGTSMYLNGSGYLSLPSTTYSVWNNLAAGSMSCWIYPTATSSLTQGVIFNKMRAGTASYSTISIGTWNGNTGTAGKLYFSLNAVGYSSACSSNTILVLNTWYHIVVTFNGTAIQFYINGILDNTFYANWNLPNDTTVTMQVGAANGGNLFTGYIDDFSLWNIALSQSTITAIYTMFMPTLTSINSAIVGTALSYTGQYQVLVTGGATNNVYYSTNYGLTFTGITVGSSLTLLGCTCSFDGSYITVYTASAVYTLNNNGSSNSVTIGYTAGNTNQGANAISIGTYAGLTNQAANSIVINATGSTMNANTAGLFIGPIQPYSVTGISPSTLNGLAYGTDNQVVTVPLPLGMGQSYINQTANRSVNAGNIYTNNTGRPMYVIVSAYANSGSTQQNTGYVYINGVLVLQKQTDTTYNGVNFVCYWDTYFVVPPGSTYQVYVYGTWGVGGVNVIQWFELS